ncbi:MAG: hypothetical protein K1X74_16600 [Pirellulales bacterium]|nr:hypothetical protein [Pirellulales bacterium]
MIADEQADWPDPSSPLQADAGEKYFVLHDFGAEKIDLNEKDPTRNMYGPSSDTGTFAFIPQTRDSSRPIYGRSRPFEQYRVTSTKYERGEDIGVTDQMVNDAVQTKTLPALQKKQENKLPNLARKLWKGLEGGKSDEDKRSVINQALNDHGFTDKVAKKNAETRDGEITKALTFLKQGGTHSTSALWAVESLCKKLTAIKNYPFKKREKQDCQDYLNAMNARNERIAARVNIEIEPPAQQTFETLGLPGQPDAYTDTQYCTIARLYATLSRHANHFLHVTTHFMEDCRLPQHGGHSDPRRFNLERLYREIAGIFGHPTGSTYGVKYRTTSTTQCEKGAPISTEIDPTRSNKKKNAKKPK